MGEGNTIGRVWYNVTTFVVILEDDMVTVGIRELKQQASELIRMVRETGGEIQVTYHGQVVALLVPVNKPKSKTATRALTQLDSLQPKSARTGKKALVRRRLFQKGADDVCRSGCQCLGFASR